MVFKSFITETGNSAALVLYFYFAGAALESVVDETRVYAATAIDNEYAYGRLNTGQLSIYGSACADGKGSLSIDRGINAIYRFISFFNYTAISYPLVLGRSQKYAAFRNYGICFLVFYYIF